MTYVFIISQFRNNKKNALSDCVEQQHIEKNKLLPHQCNNFSSMRKLRDDSKKESFISWENPVISRDKVNEKTRIVSEFVLTRF